MQSPWFLKAVNECQSPSLQSPSVADVADTLSMRMPPQPKLVRLVKEIVVVDPVAPVKGSVTWV